MKHHRPPQSGVDTRALLEAALAMRVLARTSPRVELDVPSFIGETLSEAYDGSLPIFLTELAAYVERAQRVADRFRSWRYSKEGGDEPLRRPEPIGTPFRPIRRFRDDVEVSGVVSTVLAVRALDREGGKPRERRFVTDLAAAFDGWTSQFIHALIVYAERDRRFARRFRSWRRAKAARAAGPPSRSAPAPAQRK